MTANRPIHGQPGEAPADAAAEPSGAEGFSGQGASMDTDTLLAAAERDAQRWRLESVRFDAEIVAWRWLRTFTQADGEA